jgi:hypothetical protein
VNDRRDRGAVTRGAVWDALWDAAVIAACTAVILLWGCGDRRLDDGCLELRDAAELKLERAIGRYAAAAAAPCDIAEGSGTWSCGGGPDVTVTLDFDLIMWDGVRHKTGVLAVWGDLEVFEVEDADGRE